MVTRFEHPNLPRDSRAWTRQVEDKIAALERQAERSSQAEVNANKAQSSSLDLVSRNIVDLDARVQAALSDITIDAIQVTSGTLDSGRIPEINQSKVLGAWTKDVIGNVTGDLVGNVINVPGSVYAKIFASNVTTNITETRVANWARTSDGFIATATSSRTKKANIRDVDWPDDKLEAVMSVALVYYEWIAAIEKAAYIESLPVDHPRAGEVVPVHQEIGFIAEELHAAGLWEFVAYKRNPDDSLILKNGEPIPFSIHYTNWSLALHAVVQRLWSDRKRDRADLDLVMNTLGLSSAATSNS